MTFMTPHYSNATFVEVTQTKGESYLVPQGYEDLNDGNEIIATHVGKWFCHLSADGYMDQTEWMGPYDLLQQAREAIMDTYNVDPITGDDIED